MSELRHRSFAHASGLADGAGEYGTFAQILRLRAREFPDRTAFVFLGKSGDETDRLSYAQLDAKVAGIAATLIERDLTDGNVLLVYPPGLEFIAALFACFHVGATAVPIPFTAGRRTEDRVHAIARDAAPIAILGDPALTVMDDLRMILADCGRPVPWLDTATIAAVTSPASFPAIDGDRIALLQYTSGSTGAPKGVMLSHANLIANNRMVAAAFGHDETLRGVGWLPLFHDMGLIGHVLQPVFVGGLSVIMSPFTFIQRPSRWLEAISHWRATTSGGPSHGYALCLRSLRDQAPVGLDLSSWRVAYCGAEKVRGDVLGDFARRYSDSGFDPRAFLACYGLAEASLLVSANHAGSGLRMPGSVGSASSRAISCGTTWEGGTVRIDAADGERCPDGTVGEIAVSGPHVGHGYFGKPQESAKTFVRSASDPATQTLRTGDLGFMLEGELFVVGRLKDTIIVFGAKHAAEDLEVTVARSHPVFAKHPCAAFAVDRGDREDVIIVQEAPASALSSEDLQAASERATCAITAEHGLRVEEFLLVKTGALPRTTSGKVQRSRARQLYDEGHFIYPPASAPASALITRVSP